MVSFGYRANFYLSCDKVPYRTVPSAGRFLSILLQVMVPCLRRRIMKRKNNTLFSFLSVIYFWYRTAGVIPDFESSDSVVNEK